MHAARGGMHASCRHTHDLHSSNECLLQVPAAVRRDLEALTASSGSAAVLVKEAATIAKYRLPGLAATLEVCPALRLFDSSLCHTKARSIPQPAVQSYMLLVPCPCRRLRRHGTPPSCACCASSLRCGIPKCGTAGMPMRRIGLCADAGSFTHTPPILLQSAQLFLDSYDSFRELFNALSTLDVLAGFAAATSPEAAPPGCAFCRPTFAAGAGAGDSGGSAGGSITAPPLRLQGLWNPALLASQAVDGIGGGIQAS